MDARKQIEKRLEEERCKLFSTQANIEEREHKLKTIGKGIEAWRGFEFQSSSDLTEEFASFAKDFKKHIGQSLPDGAKLVDFSRGHFYVSGFIEKPGKFVYFSVSDVRFFRDGWYNDILVRTARHIKDYSGGQNNSTSLQNFKASVSSLLGEVRQ